MPTTPPDAAAPVPAIGENDPATEAALRAGLEHHTEGRLAEARLLYDEVLARLPDNPDALHLRGVLSFAEGNANQGIALLSKAIEIQPGFMAAVANLGQMLNRLKRPAEALATFRRAVEMAPENAAAHRDMGYALLEDNDTPGAIDQLHQAVALDPDDFVAHVGLGLAMHRAGRLPEAAASLRQALGLRPAQTEIHLNLGVVLRAQAKLHEAIGSFRVALLLRPNYPEAMLNLGIALLESGRLDEALASLRAAALEQPNRSEMQFALGYAQQLNGEIDAAAASLKRAVEVASDPAEPHRMLSALLRGHGRLAEMVALERLMVTRRPANAASRVRLARALAMVGQLDEAVDACQRALALDPGAMDAHATLGAIHSVRGEVTAARAAFATVLAANPTEPAARTSLATLDLAEGNYAAGWPALEARFDLPELAAYRPATPRLALTGDLAGKRVLLVAEQGQGDTLQFLRYAPLLAARGATVLVEVQAPLVALAADIAGIASATAQGTVPPAHDLSCPMMSLPLAFGTTLASIPATIPYITAPAQRVAQWQARLPPAQGRRRIGLCWSGNPGYSADAQRSIPLALLRPLLADSSLQVHLLQTDRRAGDDAVIDGQTGLIDLRVGLGDFADTAAVMSALDLIISVDTSVAHLAGALGRPVWIMLPYAADWRWLAGRDDSPWYPTARLFRQPAFGDWAAVVAGVQAALHPQ